MVEAKRRPVIKLTPEMKTELERTGGDMIEARKVLESMKELGLDVKLLEEKLNWAEKARDMLLTRFVEK